MACVGVSTRSAPSLRHWGPPPTSLPADEWVSPRLDSKQSLSPIVSNANKQKPNQLSHVRAVLITSWPPCASKSFLQTSNNLVSRHVKQRPPGRCAADLGLRDLGARRVAGSRSLRCACAGCVSQWHLCMFLIGGRLNKWPMVMIARSRSRSRYPVQIGPRNLSEPVRVVAFVLLFLPCLAASRLPSRSIAPGKDRRLVCPRQKYELPECRETQLPSWALRPRPVWTVQQQPRRDNVGHAPRATQ